MQTAIPDLIDILRQQTRLAQLGAEFVNVKSTVQYPTFNAATQAYWVGEAPGVDVTESTPVFGAKTITAHSLQSTVLLSKQLLTQNNVSVERRFANAEEVRKVHSHHLLGRLAFPHHVEIYDSGGSLTLEWVKAIAE